MTRKNYTKDPEFNERWGDLIVEIVRERLMGYSEAVMITALGLEMYEDYLHEEDETELGSHTLREAFIQWGKENVEDCERRPMEWNDEYKTWKYNDDE